MEADRLAHQFTPKGGAVTCGRCGIEFGNGPEDCIDPHAERNRLFAERMRELKAEADRLASSADIGEAEVRRLEEILAEQKQILDESGATAEEERRALARRFHSQGRAVDYLPGRPGHPTLHAGAARPGGSAPMHIHWA